MLVHRRITPNIKFAGTYLHTWEAQYNVQCEVSQYNVPSQGSNPDSVLEIEKKYKIE